MLKKVLAGVALVGAAALTATPAAATACVDAYLEANGEVVLDQSVCV